MTQPAGDQLSLATLATRVSELAGQLGELTDLPGETARLAGELARISGMLASRPAGSQEHADQDDSEKDRWEKRKQGEEHPRNWAMLSDDASAKALRDLGRWVTSILFVSYPHLVTEFPPCWPGHDAVVAELDWLYWAWEEVWAAPEPHTRDAADWHDRWLPGVLARVRPLLASCRAEDHHVKPDYRRTVHTDYPLPPGAKPGEYWPELEFIENMRRAGRAGGQPAITA